MRYNPLTSKLKKSCLDIENIVPEFHYSKSRKSSLAVKNRTSDPLQSLHYGNQSEDGRYENQSIGNRILAAKKLQKEEKQAVTAFYAKNYSECFDKLTYCLQLTAREQLQLSEHQIYIYYLYIQFSLRLKDINKAAQYVGLARNALSKMNKNHRTKAGEYIVCILALEIKLKNAQNCHQEAIRLIESFRNKHEMAQLPEKFQKQMLNVQIHSQMNLQQWKTALHSAQSFRLHYCHKLSESESWDLSLKMATCCTKLENYGQALHELEAVLGLQLEAEVLKKSHHDRRVYQAYQKLTQDSDDSVKKLLFYRLWKENEDNAKVKAKLSLKLFQLLYTFGDYSAAVQEFSAVVDENQTEMLNWFDYSLLAEIKYFDQELREAQAIMLKAIEHCKDHNSQLMLRLRLLNSNFEDQDGLKRKTRQKHVEKILTENRVGCAEAEKEYTVYLRKRGKQQRASHFEELFRTKQENQY